VNDDDDDFDPTRFAVGDHLNAALVDLLEHGAPVLRSSLGANPHLADQVDLDMSGQPTPTVVRGWTAFAEPSTVYLPLGE
jgi:hypothetical protein